MPLAWLYDMRRSTVILELACAVPLLALAACGDGDPPAPYTLTFESDPARTGLLVAQDGDGVWQPVTLDASGHGTFEVTQGFHGYVRACKLALVTPPVHAAFARFEAGDPGAPVRACTSGGATRVTLSGSVNPADAEVAIDIVGPVQASAGTYTVTSVAGVRDIVATAGGRMLIMRDQDLTVGRTVNLDVVADGIELASVPVPVAGAGADPVTVTSELLTARRTWTTLAGAGATVALLPAAQRIAGDRVVVAAHLDGGDVRRTEQRELSNDVVPTIAFGPAPALEGNRAGATWDGDWSWISTSVSIRTLNGPAVIADASAAWLAARGPGPLPWIDPSTLPGWDSAWPRFEPGAEVSWSIGVENGDRSGDFSAAARSGTLTW
jgi:hypothetical protein